MLGHAADEYADGRYSSFPASPPSFADTDAPLSVMLDQGLEALLNAFELLALCCVVKKYQVMNSYIFGMKIHLSVTYDNFLLLDVISVLLPC